MSDDGGPVLPSTTTKVADRYVQSNAAVAAGLIVGCLGLVLALLMVLQRREVQCPDGTYHPEGSDGRCFVHPLALEGGALGVIIVMLGILIALVGLLVRAGLDSGTEPQARSGQIASQGVFGRPDLPR